MNVPGRSGVGSGFGNQVSSSSGLNAPGSEFYGDVTINVGTAPSGSGTEYTYRHLLTFLQKELRSGSRVRLLDPALREQQSLADIFVDLDVRLIPDSRQDQGGHRLFDGPPDEAFAFLQQQLSLDGASRTVLIGGPGQGKTTAVQMLAQVHRCAILRNCDPEMLSPRTAAELERVDRLLSRLELSPPSGARLPLWIEADVLAAYLRQASEARSSLWHFLAERHERVLNIPVSTDTIRALVEGRPTLLVLDGYDEVPPRYRHAVMEHVMDFADEMQVARANTAVVFTSRPQAYKDELRSHQFVAWSLAQLTPEAAERHAVILAGVEDEGQRLLSLFRTALNGSAVLDLLNTPLHVALLIALLAESGPPPTSRHLLFSRYYDHVYVREQGRGGELGAFLEKHRHLVDELHRRAAFHVLATAGDGSEQRGIAVGEFAEIARSLVREVKLADDDTELDVVRQLIRFTRERLVLIVGVDADEVGFQIKSFTEFLAAAHLAQTSDECLIRERFRAVAASEPWRNVARFMAAAAFEADSLAERDLRDSVVTVLAELDRKEFVGADALLLRGAELAVDLLMDVPDLDNRYRRHLIPSSRVIENLHNRGDTLAAVASSDFDDGRIADLIGTLYSPSDVGRDRHAAWRFLNKLAEHGNAMAAKAGREYAYQAGPDALPRLLWDIAVPQVVTPEELSGLLRQADPNMVHGSSGAREVDLPAGWAKSAWEVLHGATAQLRLDVDLEGVWHLMGPSTLRGLQSRIAGLSNPPAGCHPRWSAWARVGQVLKDPASNVVETLLQALSGLKEGDNMAKSGPWPFQELLSDTSPPTSVAVDDWYIAEDRWREKGVRLHDIETYLVHGALGRHVAMSGFPFGSVHWSTPAQRDVRISSLARDVYHIWHDKQDANPGYHAHIAGNVLVPMCDYGLQYDVDTFEPAQIREIINAVPASDDMTFTLPTVCHALSECPSNETFSNLAARVVHSRWSTGYDREQRPSAHDIVERAYRVLPEVTFREFCRKIAMHSASPGSWEALNAYWIDPATPGHADWPLVALLRARGESPSRRDIARAAAAEESVWGLFDLMDNAPFWSEETRAWVREELLVQIGEPWMTNAPTIWRRARQPIQPIPLAALGLTIP
ncbi:hypothetical protein [Streptomyces sp. NPDC020298]|uniref:NACHT domain-containing protein n=1 Tax=unclassified Streptomyces TaxID=2593676 RepID=UPI0033E65BD2